MSRNFKKTTVVIGVFSWGEEYDALRQAVGFTPDCCHEASDISEAIGRVREARVHGHTLFIKTPSIEMAKEIVAYVLPDSRNGRAQLQSAMEHLEAGRAVKINYPSASLKSRVIVESIEFPRSTPAVTPSQQTEKLAA